MALSTDHIRQARSWALHRYQGWKRQIRINDLIAADLWEVIHDDDTVEDEDPLVENVYKAGLEDKMASAAAPEPSLIVGARRGTRKDAAEGDAQQRRQVFLSYIQRSEDPFRLRLKAYRDWLHTGAAYFMPWTDWHDPQNGVELAGGDRMPYFHRFDPRTAYPIARNMRGEITEFMTIARRPFREMVYELGDSHPAVQKVRHAKSGRALADQDFVEDIWYFNINNWARMMLDPGIPAQHASQLILPQQVIDASQTTFETGAWITEPEPHGLSRCPVASAERVTHDDGMPRGALEDVIPQLKIANNFMRKLLDDNALAIFSPVVVDGVVNPEDYGPGAILIGDGSGNARVQRDRPNVNFEANQVVRTIMEQVKSQAFQPQQRSGTTGASIISDRAVNSVQAQFNEELGWAMSDHEVLMTRTLSLTAEFDEVWCSPPDGEKKKAETIEGLELLDVEYHPSITFGGDYRVKVDYGPHRGQDRQNHLTQLALMMNLGGMSVRDFMQRSGMVPDVLQAERDMLIERLVGAQGLFLNQILPEQIAAGNLEPLVRLVEAIDDDKKSVREVALEVIKETLAPTDQGVPGGPGGPPGAADILQQVQSLQAGGIPGNAEGLPLPGPELSRALPAPQRRLAEAG